MAMRHVTRSGLLALTLLGLLLVPTAWSAASSPTLEPGQTATLLPDCRWLLVGGDGPGGPSDAIEVWTPASGATVLVRRGLHHPRAWHSATLLPDGTVLVVGGWGRRGAVVEAVEWIDPAAADVQDGRIRGLTPRAAHTATLLTDGQVLIAGGIGADGRLLASAQRWDPSSRRLEPVAGRLTTPRAAHDAELASDGAVWLTGGADAQGGTPPRDDRYDPVADVFAAEAAGSAAPSRPPGVAGSHPADGAVGVPQDTTIAARFSISVDVTTLSQFTVFLNSAHGVEAVQVMPAEAGRLVFLTPSRALRAGTEYTVTVNGPTLPDGTLLAVSTVRFTTRGAPPGGGGTGSGGGHGDERPRPGDGPGDLDWRPDPRGPDRWTMDAAPSPWQGLAPLLAPPGVTALGGQVLTLRGDPLSEVTLRVNGTVTRTDHGGRFLLAGLLPGRQVLLIDGRSANRSGRVYGVFKVGVELIEGRTTILPYTTWMPRIDTAHAMTIDTPTARDLVITTPHIPGLELYIPAGTTITDHEHHPVRQITITPVPLDRPPFPLARGLTPPAYFTIQPGAGYVYNAHHQGVRLTYPNRFNWPPGTRTQFWHYDPGDKGWHVYGEGGVTPDGQQAVPDPGVGIYEFTGAMMVGCPQNNRCKGKPGVGPESYRCNCDPVDTWTGRFLYRKTDLYLADVIPIALTRTYQSGDPSIGPFGIGSDHPYEIFPQSDALYSEADVFFADGTQVHYVRISGSDATPGSNVFEHTASPGRFYKSRIAWNSADAGWNLTLKDGTVYVFGDVAPLQAIRDRFGNQLTITRTNGQTGNITRVTSPHGRWVEFTYDGSNRVAQATDNIGQTVSYAYDGSSRLAAVTDATGGITSYTYDSNHRMLTITDPRGIVYLTNTYDTQGRVVQQTRADGTTFQLAYTTDGSGKVIQTDVTDPRGFVQRLTFNATGYILTETFALGQPEQQTFTYTRESGSNAPLSMTDALGRQTAYTYDAKKNMTSVTRLAGTADAVTTTYTYEPTFGQVASVTDPLNHTTSFTYDSKGVLATITDPLNQQTTLTTNSAGQPVAVQDSLSHTTQFGYDFGDLTTITDPLGNITRRFVDSGGRLTAIADPQGRTTRFEYDALNRLTRITDAKSGATAFTYDGNGNLLTVTDAKSNTTSYAYNSMNRVETLTDPLTHQETYEYDDHGNLSQVTDRKSQATTFTYDALNRHTQTTYADTATTSYVYDAGDRLTGVVDSVTGTLSRAYDGLDRLTQDVTSNGTVSYSYDAAGRRTGMTVAGQPTVSYSYDTADRLTGITQGGSSVAFGYDAAARRTSLTLPNGIVIESAYDAASRLTGLTYKLGGALIGALSYGYDASGSRSLLGGPWARTRIPVAVATSSYDAKNQQLAFGAATMSYDSNGNLVSLIDGGGTTSYTWDARDQLAGISGPGLAATFGYDGLGRRRTRTINTAQTDYLYDALNPVQEGVLPASPAANLLTGLRLDEVFTRTDAAGLRALLADALGSTLALADSTGAVSTEYAYEPFGATSVSGSSSANSFQYTGRENDGTGLYYYRARYYSPRIGRFISEDPIVSEDRSPWELNAYVYAASNPVNWIDPTGEYSQIACIVTYTAAGAMAGGSYGATAGGTAGLALAGIGAIPGGGIGAGGGAIMGGGAGALAGLLLCPPDDFTYCAEHRKGARPSTQGQHEAGQARGKMDRGNEKGDDARRPPRKRPPNHRGPWPPRPK
jgi:RHS repeat-associated protein